MTFYRSIRAVQEPFELPVDELRRAQYVFNVNVDKTSSIDVDLELVRILELAGVGVYNETIFITNRVVIPGGDGPYLGIVQTGGLAPEYTQNEAAPAWRRPAAQVMVVAMKPRLAIAMIQSAFNALTTVTNRSV